MKIENFQVNPERKVTKTISMPIWMDDYLKHRAAKEGISVSGLFRQIIQKDIDLQTLDQVPAAAGGENT